MSKIFLHISEEFEYTWLGKDNGMIPIYMSEKLGYDSKILTVNLKMIYLIVKEELNL